MLEIRLQAGDTRYTGYKLGLQAGATSYRLQVGATCYKLQGGATSYKLYAISYRLQVVLHATSYKIVLQDGATRWCYKVVLQVGATSWCYKV